MRYAVVSDIHGNLEALVAVLKDIKKRKADKIVCLGDIVGYYPNPQKCIELIRANAAACVAGNHDYAAIGKVDTGNFTYFAFSAMEWTKQNLSDADREFLHGLHLTYEEEDLFFTHASPNDPQKFLYVFPDNEHSVFEAFKHLRRRLNFIGHTHCPMVICREGNNIVPCTDTTVDIREECSYLINVGSVGQPRDYDNRSCYVIYDSDKQELAFHRVPYKFRVTQKKIKDSGLHVFLAERLERGR